LIKENSLIKMRINVTIKADIQLIQ